MLAIIYTYTYILNAFNSKGRGKTKRERLGGLGFTSLHARCEASKV